MKCEIKISNLVEIENKMKEITKPICERALMELAMDVRTQCILQLERGFNASICDDLKIEQLAWNEFRIFSLYNMKAGYDLWELLDGGTGIYNPEHAGAGPGGRIVPVNMTKDKYTGHERKLQTLHFIWHGSERFYGSVRGIKPRHFFSVLTEEVLLRRFLFNLNKLEPFLKLMEYTSQIHSEAYRHPPDYEQWLK
jgi:hypothetical protein